MFATKLDFHLVQVSMCVVVPARCVSREQGGCLSSSRLQSMCCVSDLMQDSKPSSYGVLSWLLFLV